jgi:hypothetical protein
VPSFGSAEVPSFGRTSVPSPKSRNGQNQVGQAAPSQRVDPSVPARTTPVASCKTGAALEPREYTQPEFLGRPSGLRARLCFFRQLSNNSVDILQFYPSGHFVLTTQNGSGGFALSGSVNGTSRGTYGFSGGSLHLRTGYSGISVSQAGRGAGSERGIDTASQQRLEREIVLPNCQKITVMEHIKRVSMPSGSGHPRFLVIDGERWEHMSIDCPDWRGWIRD